MGLVEQCLWHGAHGDPSETLRSVLSKEEVEGAAAENLANLTPCASHQTSAGKASAKHWAEEVWATYFHALHQDLA